MHGDLLVFGNEEISLMNSMTFALTCPCTRVTVLLLHHHRHHVLLFLLHGHLHATFATTAAKYRLLLVLIFSTNSFSSSWLILWRRVDPVHAGRIFDGLI